MNFQKKNLGLLVLAVMTSMVLPAEAATKLENIKINDSLASQTSIEFKFDGPLAGYQDRLQYSPEQLVLSLNDAESALARNELEVNTKGIDKVKVSANGANLDVAVALDTLVPYEVSQQGNSLIVTLGQDPRVTATKNGYNKPTLLNSSKGALAAGINKITGINFKRGSNGEGVVVVNLDNKNAAVELVPKGTHLLAKFHGSSVVQDLLAVMDVVDYTTIVKNIDVSETVDGAVLDFALLGSEFDSKFEQNGNQVIVTVNKKKPVIKAQAASKYSGKLLSLSFQDIPVRNALKILAEEVKINLVMNDSVSGNITVNFDSVPWDQALDTILRVKGLDKRIEGSILLVGTQDELSAYEQKQLEEIEKRQAKEPLVTEYIQINYAKATDILKLISTKDSETSIAAADSNNGYGSSSNSVDSDESLLSARGTVSVDERTNTLIIKDTEASIANIKRLVENLDTPIEQVVIEARIVAVQESVADELGIEWSSSNNGGNFASNGGHGENSIIPTSNGTGIKGDPHANRWFVGGDVSPTSNVLSLGRISDKFSLSLALKALETESKTEIIASPRVTTTNQKQSVIEQGYEIPAATQSASGGTTIEWKKAVLSLAVTPQITPDDSIFLDLQITQDSLGDDVTTSSGKAISIATRKLNTQVLVGNGETLVLGGIYEQTISRKVNQVPLLGDIPIIGYLFKTVSNSNDKREVLVFITPHILKDEQ